MRALIVLALAGCFTKPPAPGATSDASKPLDARIDGAPGSAPVPRLVANAWFSDNYPAGGPHNGPVVASNGMSITGYEVDATGLVPGDLLLFFGSIDNGDDSIWQLPAGFSVIDHRKFGNDGQTIIAGWKVATETGTHAFTGTYGGTNVYSAAATISLVAVSGARTDVAPDSTTDDTLSTTPTLATSAGLTTTVPNTTMIYFGAADWEVFTGTNTISQPLGYLSLAKITDHGNTTNFDWTSQQVASRVEPDPITTGPVSGAFDATQHACGGTFLLAVQPAL